VERYASEQFRKEVDEALQMTRESVFEAVFHTVFPDTIFREIRDLILAQPFIRKRVYASIVMRWPDDGGREFLDFTVSIAYDVHNLTDRTQTYPVCAQVLRPTSPVISKDVKFLKLVIGDKSYTTEELGSLASPNDTEVCLEEVIELGPGGSEHIEVQAWRRVECKDYYTLYMTPLKKGVGLSTSCGYDIMVQTFMTAQGAPDVCAKRQALADVYVRQHQFAAR
jgi:hypothetical protein